MRIGRAALAELSARVAEAAIMDGPAMRLIRKRQNRTQEQWARALGITRGYLGELERSTDQLDRRTALAVRYLEERGCPL